MARRSQKMSVKHTVATQIVTSLADASIKTGVNKIAAKSGSPHSVPATTSLIGKIPAIGFEMETVTFTLCGADITTDNTFQDPEFETKGQKLRFFKSSRQPDTELNKMAEGKTWEPTAEIQLDLSRIQLEFIYGGKKGREIATAGEELAAVGKEIRGFLNALDERTKATSTPARVDNLAFMLPKNFEHLATDPQHVGCGWINTKALSQTPGVGVQATAPIPLAALPDLIKNRKSGKLSDPDLIRTMNSDKSAFGQGGKRMIGVSPDQIKDSLAGIEWRDKCTKKYGEHSVSGLMIMIMSYVNVAANSISDQDMDLKKQTDLMPRTDFQTMVKIVTDLMSAKSAEHFSTNLWDMVEKLAESSNIQERLNGYFNWGSESSKEAQPSSVSRKSNSLISGDALSSAKGKLRKAQDRQLSAVQDKTPPLGKSLAPRQTDVPPSSLPVKEWIQDLAKGKPDLIAVKDNEFRGGQIGKLGKTVETLIGNDKFLCPILEFRDMVSTVAGLIEEPQNFMQRLLEEIKAYHESACKMLGNSST